MPRRWVLPRPGPPVRPPQLLLGGPPGGMGFAAPVLSSPSTRLTAVGEGTHLPCECFYTVFLELLQCERQTRNSCSYFRVIYETSVEATCSFTWRFPFLIGSYFLELSFRMEVLNRVRLSFMMTKNEVIYQNSLYLYFHIVYANDVIAQETFFEQDFSKPCSQSSNAQG